MKLTQQQILQFTQRARAAGLSEAQIQGEIVKKEQELAGAGGYNQTAQIQQPQAPQQPQMGQPAVRGAQTFGGQSAQSQAPVQQTNEIMPAGNDSSFITRFMGALVEPAVNYGKLLAEAGSQVARVATDPTYRKSVLNQPLSTDEQATLATQKPFVVLDNEKIKDNLDVAKFGAKATAGASSYLVPGANSVKGAATLAGAAGVLDAASRDNVTVKDAAIAGVTSAATGGAFSVLGKAINAIKPAKIASTLEKKAQDVAVRSYVKEVGSKPLRTEGGRQLLEDMYRIGIKPGDSEKVLQQASDVIQQNSGEILNATIDLDNKGVTVPVQNIVGFLEDQIKNSKSVVSKGPIQQVLNTIRQDFGDATEMTASDLYLLKAEYGPLGSWSKTQPQVEQRQAEVWRSVYTKMNDLMDETLKNNGYEDFREVNDAVHTAIKASQYAGRVANVAPNRNTFGLLDVIAGGTAAASGFSVPGAAAVGGIAARKVLESGRMGEIGTNVLNKLGSIAKTLPENAAPATGTLANNVSKTVGGMAAGLVPEKGPQDQVNGQSNNESANQAGDNVHSNIIPQDPELAAIESQIPTSVPSQMSPFGNLTKRQVLSLALTQGASSKELKEISDLYDMVQPEGVNVTAETAKVANDLRTEYFTRTKENGFLEVTNQYSKVTNTSDNAAGDLSLIFAYMKMLDPSSTVREGEFANAQNATGVPQQIMNTYNKIAKGERLNKSQREQFKSEAQNIYGQYQQSQAQIDALYQGLAQQYGIPANLVGVGTFNR